MNKDNLFRYYNELNNIQKEKLKSDIDTIDFEKMKNIYEKSMQNDEIDITKISPLQYYDKKVINKEYYKNLGIKYLSKYALITMAGGNGTRLEWDGPKGTYPLLINNKKISIFEIFINDLKDIQRNSGVFIHWYIMTGESNDKDTRKFFEENNFFGYPQEKISFFKQSTLPILDVSGNCVLKDKYSVLKESDGNGTIFSCLKENNILNDLKNNSIEYIGVMNIDNILSKVFDPIFIGLMVSKNYQVGAKTSFKKEPLSKDYIYCKYEKKPIMLDYNFISLDLSMQQINNKYLYRDINLGMYVFTLDALNKLESINLPYHRAYKKYKFINNDGNVESGTSPNSFKFEKFIYDAFSYFNDLLLYRVDEDTEFAPIKNKEGNHSPKDAIEKFIKTKDV